MSNEPMIKEVDGVKVMRLFDGNWYCNFTDYKVRQIRDRGWYNKAQFIEWCGGHSLCPIL